MRLIDTDEILTKIQKAYVDTDLGTNKRAIAINIGLTKALNIVQDCKKIERKKGKWILVSDADETGNALYECPVCHKGEVHVPIVKVNYCWNCGADMRGEDNEV